MVLPPAMSSGAAKPIIMYDFFKDPPTPRTPRTLSALDRCAVCEEDEKLLEFGLSCNGSSPAPATGGGEDDHSLDLTLSCDASPQNPLAGMALEDENDPILKLSLSCSPPSSSLSSASVSIPRNRKRAGNPFAGFPSRPPKKPKSKLLASQERVTSSNAVVLPWREGRVTSSNTVMLLGTQETRFSPNGRFVIKKALEESDTNNLARLMLAKGAVEEHVFAYWDDEMKESLKDKEGVVVRVWDSDCDIVFDMKIKIWGRNGSVVLNDRWVSRFVNRRGLKKGHQIGLYWDRIDRRLVFSVLRRDLIAAIPISYRLPDC